MKKRIFILILTFLLIKTFSVSMITGRNSFYIDSGISQRKKIRNSLFFNALYDEDKLKLKLEYDDQHEEDNGIINLKLEFDKKIKYGFYFENNIFLYDNSRYHGLSYQNRQNSITGGWFSGKRVHEKYLINGKQIISLKNTDLIENTDSVLVNGRKLKKNIDYYIDYFSGIITLIPIFPYDSIIECSYSYRNISNKNEPYFSLHHNSDSFNYSIIKDINRVNIKNKDVELEYWMNINESSINGGNIKYKNRLFDVIYFPDYGNDKEDLDVSGIHPQLSIDSEDLSIDIFDTYECYYLKVDPIIDVGILNKNNTSLFGSIQGKKKNIYFDSYFLKEESKGISLNSMISVRLRKDLRFFEKDDYFEGNAIDRERTLMFFNSDLIISSSYINGDSSIKLTQKNGKLKKGISFHSDKDPIFELNYRDKVYSTMITYDDSFFIRSSISFSDYILSYEKKQNINDLYRIDIRNIYFRLTFSYSKDIQEDTSVDIPLKENSIRIEYDALKNIGKYSYIVDIR